MARSGAIIVGLLAIVAEPAGAAGPPPGAISCSGCHASSAAVETPVPRLAGRPASEIVAAMQAFRDGSRPATVMDRIAKGFSDAETAAIAAWYAEQKP
jgi:cytochrome c553